ncbi:MAG: hypothetical protein QOG45_1393 [Chloroflexota bacterium]|nr:hypothetical protein [Chloroflexota bacterium]
MVASSLRRVPAGRPSTSRLREIIRGPGRLPGRFLPTLTSAQRGMRRCAVRRMPPTRNPTSVSSTPAAPCFSLPQRIWPYPYCVVTTRSRSSTTGLLIHPPTQRVAGYPHSATDPDHRDHARSHQLIGPGATELRLGFEVLDGEQHGAGFGGRRGLGSAAMTTPRAHTRPRDGTTRSAYWRRRRLRPPRRRPGPPDANPVAAGCGNTWATDRRRGDPRSGPGPFRIQNWPYPHGESNSGRHLERVES